MNYPLIRLPSFSIHSHIPQNPSQHIPAVTELAALKEVHASSLAALSSLKEEHDTTLTALASLKKEHDTTLTALASLKKEHTATLTELSSLKESLNQKEHLLNQAINQYNALMDVAMQYRREAEKWHNYYLNK